MTETFVSKQNRSQTSMPTPCSSRQQEFPAQTREAVPIVILVAILLPWLNPMAPGPSPAVVPWLVSLAATAALLLLVAFIDWFPRFSLAPRPSSPVAPRRFVQTIATSWLIAGVASSLIGFFQYFGVASYFIPWFSLSPLGEAFANLRQRNQFASLTNIALAALIWLAIKSSNVRDLNMQPKWRRQALILLAAGLLTVGNAASSSRTGLLQLVLVVALCGIWGLWRQRLVLRVLVGAVLTYGVAIAALPLLSGFDLSLHGLGARLVAGDSACASRTTLWSNVMHLIAQKPWLGWGWGELDFAHYMTLYNGPRFCDILDNAHNLPLQLAVELGIPVTLLICGGFTWWVLWQKPWQETDPTRQLAWSVIAVILLHSMLEYPLWYGPFQMAFGLCMMMLWRRPMPSAISSPTFASVAPAVAINAPIDKPIDVTNSLVAPVIRAFIAIILISISIYAAWDYRRISQIYVLTELRDPAYRVDTLGKIKGSWLFSDQVQFAELLMTPLTRENAQWTFQRATALLHFSPEPRVIERVIESATMLGRDDEAAAHLARYRAAFPLDYAKFKLANASKASALEGSESPPSEKD